MAERPADPIGLRWRPLQRSVLDELSVLLTAMEHLDEPAGRHSVEEIYEAYEATDSEPDIDTVVGRDAGDTLVAYGWNHRLEGDVDPRRVHLTGGVHPGWRRHGIGSALIAWQLQQAHRSYLDRWREGHGPLRVFCPVDEKLAEQRTLYERAGLQPLRWYADLALTFDGAPPQVPAPPGVRIVPMRHEHLEQVRQAHNEAFADHWGSQPVNQVRWAEQLGRASVRLAWSWVALDATTSEIVGYATNAAYEQDWEAQGSSDGWTDRLGVRRGWRGRGIAKALLAASMKSFADAGLEAAGLGVDTDSPTGAFALYESMGYRSLNTVVMYARDEQREDLLGPDRS